MHLRFPQHLKSWKCVVLEFRLVSKYFISFMTVLYKKIIKMYCYLVIVYCYRIIKIGHFKQPKKVM